MKPFSRVVIAFFCMTCLMCGCTRDISRSEQISERIEQLEKVSRSEGEGFLAYAIKDNISHLTNRLEQVALARRFADNRRWPIHARTALLSVPGCVYDI